MQIKG